MVASSLVFVHDPQIGHRPADLHALALAKVWDIRARLLLRHEELPAQPYLVLPRRPDVYHLFDHAFPPLILVGSELGPRLDLPAPGGEPNPLGAKGQR